MQVLDPSTGPIPREEFAKLLSAPYGEAAKRIRRYDPMWGRADGEKIKWRVEVTGQITGSAYVEASSEDEASKAAENLSAAEIDWDGGREDFQVLSIEPAVS
jgi:hypothetical protein